MCYNEDIYHSQCGHWGKKVYSKCANTAVSKWATGCWEKVTTGSARESSQCATCRLGRTGLTAGTLSPFLRHQQNHEPVIVPSQPGDLLLRLLERRTGDAELVGTRALH